MKIKRKKLLLPHNSELHNTDQARIIKVARSKQLDSSFMKHETLLMFYFTLIRSPMGVEHSGEGIFSRRPHNAKLFERIEHSGGR